jgi:hypothetical protein
MQLRHVRSGRTLICRPCLTGTPLLERSAARNSQRAGEIEGGAQPSLSWQQQLLRTYRQLLSQLLNAICSQKIQNASHRPWWHAAALPSLGRQRRFASHTTCKQQGAPKFRFSSGIKKRILRNPLRRPFFHFRYCFGGCNFMMYVIKRKLLQASKFENVYLKRMINASHYVNSNSNIYTE